MTRVCKTITLMEDGNLTNSGNVNYGYSSRPVVNK